MEIQSNQNSNANSALSNVELTLLGIEKKWVRLDGSWVDKSKLPIETESNAPVHDLNLVELEAGSSHWWQFWRA